MDLDALADHHLEQHQKHSVESAELATSISELSLPKDQPNNTSGTSFLRQALMATTSQSFSR